VAGVKVGEIRNPKAEVRKKAETRNPKKGPLGEGLLTPAQTWMMLAANYK
jgi:hypothetical protein